MFKLFRSNKDGLYYWHLRADNGKILAHSEGYTSKQAAVHGVHALIHLIKNLD